VEEDKLSDEGIGASADEKSDTSSQVGSQRSWCIGLTEFLSLLHAKYLKYWLTESVTKESFAPVYRDINIGFVVQKLCTL